MATYDFGGGPGNAWTAHVTIDDASGGAAVAVKAAVTGKSHYVTAFLINTEAAITLKVGDGTDYLGPFTLSNPLSFQFPVPIKFAEATALTFTASGAGQCELILCGFTE